MPERSITNMFKNKTKHHKSKFCPTARSPVHFQFHLHSDIEHKESTESQRVYLTVLWLFLQSYLLPPPPLLAFPLAAGAASHSFSLSSLPQHRRTSETSISPPGSSIGSPNRVICVCITIQPPSCPWVWYVKGF